jgi:hypothetical protein
MGRRLTRVERVMARLHADLGRSPAVSEDFCSRPLGTYKPPAPHARQQVSIGGNVHTDGIVKTDSRTTAQVLHDMVYK